MQAKKNDLLGVLNRLSPFFVEKSISPILECLHFDDSGIQVYTGEIYATSTDSTLQGLVGSVKSNLFLKAIEHMQKDDINLVIKDGVLKLSSGGVKADLKLITDDYFKFNIEQENWEREIPLDILVTALQKVLVSTSELRPEFNGVFLKIKDKKLYLFSTDNLSISRVIMPYSEKDFTTFLPKTFCERILTLFSETKQGILYFSNSYIKCVLGSTTVIFPIEELTMINYEQSFLRWEDTENTFTPISILKEVINRNYILNNLMTDLDKSFFVEFKEKEIIITSKSDWGIVDESIEYTPGFV